MKNSHEYKHEIHLFIDETGIFKIIVNRFRKRIKHSTALKLDFGGRSAAAVYFLLIKAFYFFSFFRAGEGSERAREKKRKSRLNPWRRRTAGSR